MYHIFIKRSTRLSHFENKHSFVVIINGGIYRVFVQTRRMC